MAHDGSGHQPTGAILFIQTCTAVVKCVTAFCDRWYFIATICMWLLMVPDKSLPGECIVAALEHWQLGYMGALLHRLTGLRRAEKQQCLSLCILHVLPQLSDGAFGKEPSENVYGHLLELQATT